MSAVQIVIRYDLSHPNARHTRAQYEAAVALYLDDATLSVADAAEEHGIGYRQLARVLGSNGLQRAPTAAVLARGQAQAARAASLAQVGLSRREIADDLGVSPRSAARYLARARAASGAPV